MSLTPEERMRCHECLKKLYNTKLICLQSVQYLIEQQHEIDECIADLKFTKLCAQDLNMKVSVLNAPFWLRICCLYRKRDVLEMHSNESNRLFVLPFPANGYFNENNSTFGINVLKNDFQLTKLMNSVNISYSEFSTRDEFEKILHEEYSTLFELAKQLTTCVQVIHDTMELLGTDIKITLDHMQLVQPQIKQLLRTKAPLAFAQIQKDSAI